MREISLNDRLKIVNDASIETTVYTPHGTIFEAGDSAEDAVYVVASGCVTIFNSYNVALAINRPGQVLEEYVSNRCNEERES